jgi:transcription initiation factor IIF auxiliary subunit
VNNESIDHFSLFRESKHGYDIHDFCVFINEDSATLTTIKEVEYTLHPTFPNPVRVVQSPDDCFALLSDAWGDFTVRVRIFFKDSNILRLSHSLRLERNKWPMGRVLDAFPSHESKAVYEALIEQDVHWRKTSTLMRRAMIDAQAVDSALRALERERAVRQNYYKSIDMEELWGATARVGVLPTPRLS